jgi:hypothetical protein
MSLLAVSFILPILFIVLFFISFDLLVKFEHDYFQEQWIQDGRPGQFLVEWRCSSSSAE